MTTWKNIKKSKNFVFLFVPKTISKTNISVSSTDQDKYVPWKSYEFEFSAPHVILKEKSSIPNKFSRLKNYFIFKIKIYYF